MTYIVWVEVKFVESTGSDSISWMSKLTQITTIVYTKLILGVN